MGKFVFETTAMTARVLDPISRAPNGWGQATWEVWQPLREQLH